MQDVVDELGHGMEFDNRKGSKKLSEATLLTSHAIRAIGYRVDKSLILIRVRGGQFRFRHKHAEGAKCAAV